MLCSTNNKTADKLIHQLNNFFSVFCSLKCCSSDDESVICSSAAKLLQFIDIQVREITHLHFMPMYILCLSFFFWKSHPSLKFKFIWGRGVSRFPDSPYEGGHLHSPYLVQIKHLLHFLIKTLYPVLLESQTYEDHN